MIRAVLDSNVYISAVVFGGNPRAILQLAEHGAIACFTSTRVVEEIEGTLASKFQWSETRIRSVGRRAWRAARQAQTQIKITDCADPDDNRILECALSACANFMVTGDRHLLVLNLYRGIPILRPREFLDLAPWRVLPL
ncbi:MAG TPA: putative toxin-antitoxin system toxin component, PIN family [Bryobacteraceae bacterium]|nr:putative toxin-antitoxin system toxin component, PIN family [Bryobacteraceae bacterium]